MVVHGIGSGALSDDSNYDRHKELKAFEDSKAGVKGLVDAGITNIPRMFIRPPQPHHHHHHHQYDNNLRDTNTLQSTSIPVIDLHGINENIDAAKRKEVVDKVKHASETWGFFQVVNHGIPLAIMEEMKHGVGRFFEQDLELKKQFYTSDFGRKYRYTSNFDLYKAPFANWRDTLFCAMAPDPPHPEEAPAILRDIQLEYTKQVMGLGSCLFKLLSEALGLKPSHLEEMGCAEGLSQLCHYYPPCPQPELTLGTSSHSDNDFLTVLMQDQIGGLQVLHQDQWVDVPPLPGALVVNIGDLLQLISNDKFKSVEHRVLANREGPRISVACFFTTGLYPCSRLFGPIKELVSVDNPPLYRQTTVQEFVSYVYEHGLDGTSPLHVFRL